MLLKRVEFAALFFPHSKDSIACSSKTVVANEDFVKLETDGALPSSSYLCLCNHVFEDRSGVINLRAYLVRVLLNVHSVRTQRATRVGTEVILGEFFTFTLESRRVKGRTELSGFVRQFWSD
ncbi:unnamed protein product [Macrosiphum euphorbiae]|uniref:Uncharacterized protein n=1 Tax=Macrosiphum euphorbiae TaxID=13131 RepID=A0AAV0VJF2_9HEMI|nr:unnamed protein product [Macrosiphum euphorbiae]